MSYLKETRAPLKDCIDCYWQSSEPGDAQVHVYPSLPEPYINLFFPVNADEKATLKGISAKADFLEVRSALFGVRLFLRGFFQLDLAPCSAVINQLITLESIGAQAEKDLAVQIADAYSFQERVILFQDYFAHKATHPISTQQAHIADALQYLISHYKDPKIIQHYADVSGVSPRTIARWFSSEIGINAKKLARIARFHTALSMLHTANKPGFYFDCGYYDQAHFIRDFKEFTGITPEEYASIVARQR